MLSALWRKDLGLIALRNPLCGASARDNEHTAGRRRGGHDGRFARRNCRR